MLHVNKTQVWVSIEDNDHRYEENVTEKLKEMADDGDPFFDTPISLKGAIEIFAPDGVFAVIKDICPSSKQKQKDAWKIFLCDTYERFVQGDWYQSWVNEDCTIRCYHKIIEVME